MVLEWLSVLADVSCEDYVSHISDTDNLEDILFQVNSRKDISLPPSLPVKSDQMIPVLREHFKDNVTLISLVLSHYYPTKYVYYRYSKLEEAIFEGLEILSEIRPEFTSLFPIGKTDFKRYLDLNKALLTFANEQWADLRWTEIRARILFFLYEGLGRLFSNNASPVSRYWIMGTREGYFGGLDGEDNEDGDEEDEEDGDEIEWSGRKEMREGDLVFMYRMSPRKAITALYQVTARPSFNPFSSWDGFWVDLKKVTDIEDITFEDMETDQVFSTWGLVRSHFQGVMTEPVSPVIYNRLLERVPLEVRQEYDLEPEEISDAKFSGKYASEAEFEEKIVEPLLKRLGFRYRAQFPCSFRIGSQYHTGRLDFEVSHEGRPLTIVESKVRIMGRRELRPAADQAKSYALLLGYPSFIVAAPEGLWVYSLNKSKERLEMEITPDKVNPSIPEIKELLLKLRDNV